MQTWGWSKKQGWWMASRASIERAISCAVARAASAANLQDALVNRLVSRVDKSTVCAHTA